MPLLPPQYISSSYKCLLLYTVLLAQSSTMSSSLKSSLERSLLELQLDSSYLPTLLTLKYCRTFSFTMTGCYQSNTSLLLTYSYVSSRTSLVSSEPTLLYLALLSIFTSSLTQSLPRLSQLCYVFKAALYSLSSYSQSQLGQLLLRLQLLRSQLTIQLACQVRVFITMQLSWLYFSAYLELLQRYFFKMLIMTYYRSNVVKVILSLASRNKILSAFISLAVVQQPYVQHKSTSSCQSCRASKLQAVKPSLLDLSTLLSLLLTQLQSASNLLLLTSMLSFSYRQNDSQGIGRQKLSYKTQTNRRTKTRYLYRTAARSISKQQATQNRRTLLAVPLVLLLYVVSINRVLSAIVMFQSELRMLQTLVNISLGLQLGQLNVRQIATRRLYRNVLQAARYLVAQPQSYLVLFATFGRYIQWIKFQAQRLSLPQLDKELRKEQLAP